MIDFLIINPGNRAKVYQTLGNEVSAIEQPTFALLVARYLLKQGHSVEVIDVPATTLTDEEVAKLVEEHDPILVGMYAYGYQPNASTQNMISVKDIAQAIKDLNPNRKIMVSGTHPSALPQDTLSKVNCDYVCDREGIKTPHQLIECLKSNGDIDKVQDLWYDGKFTYRGLIATLDEMNTLMDIPAWELVKMDTYRSHNWQSFGNLRRKPYASIYTSLGCPFKCSFCCINSPFGDMMNGPRPYRLWSPKVIIKQIDRLVNEYGVYNLKIVDEMFVLNENHVTELCDLIIERGYDLNIWAYARVDTTKPQLLDKLKRAGINWLALGIESASSYVRDGSNKSFKDEDIVKVVRQIQEHGLYIVGNYMFGLPDDDMDTMKNTLELSIYLKTEWANFFSAMAYPGSPLYHMAIQKGWPLPDTWLGYSHHSYETCPLPTNSLTNAEVLRFRDYAHVKYFSDPGYLEYLKTTFGEPTLAVIDEMMQHKLKRKLLGD